MTDATPTADPGAVAAPAPLLVPVLELRHVNAAYGPFRALFDVSLTVGEGETVALLGRNGAGKTTVARVASGLVEPTEGEVMVDGNDFTKVRAHRYAKAGVVHVPEGRAVFPDFSVEENLTLAFSRTHDRSGVRDALGRAFDLFPPHRPAPPPDRRHPLRRRAATKVRAHRYAKAGVVHVPEGRAVFPDFSVEENLTLAFSRTHDRSGVRDALGRAFDLFPPIAQRRRQIAGTLSGGEQRMLAMARVLVETPRLLIADELSLGLAPIVTDEVYAVLTRIRDAGTALLIVEQHVGHALALCDRAILLDHGTVTWQGPTAEAAQTVGTSLFDTSGEQ